MNFKNFEYLNKDLPLLKKELAYRLTFLVIFSAILIIQLISVLKHFIKNTLNLGMMIASSMVLLTCLLFIIVSIMYILKTIKIIGVVKTSGRCVSSVDILINTKKDGFTKLYSNICTILGFISIVIFACGATYSILESIYYQSISFYLPLLATISSTTFYSALHLKNEINIVKTVREYHHI